MRLWNNVLMVLAILETAYPDSDEPWILWASYGQNSVWCSLVDDTMTVDILIIICG